MKLTPDNSPSPSVIQAQFLLIRNCKISNIIILHLIYLLNHSYQHLQYYFPATLKQQKWIVNDAVQQTGKEFWIEWRAADRLRQHIQCIDTAVGT